MKKLTKILVSTFVLLGLTIGLMSLKKANDNSFEIIKNIEIFNTLYKELNKNYVDELDPTEMMTIAITAMLKACDPYTRYISEADVERYRINKEGRYEGLGARVKKIGDYVTIIEPYENGPAKNAGLLAGDKIAKIEEIDVKGLTPDDVQDILNGYPSENISLTIQRYGQEEPIIKTLSRQEIDAHNVPFSGMVNDKVGYVVLTKFSENAAKNVRGAIAELKTNNPELEGIVLDLRNNPGGYLREAIALCNVFIPKDKIVVSTRNKVPEWSQEYKTKIEPLDTEIPLAVLINSSSASASEIVSGVMQDYDRGVLVGEKSFGKGLVQNTRPLLYKTQLKMTTSKYYIPSGRCIQSVSYNEDGEPIEVEESRRNKFSTASGREVYDGGGVSPDIEVSSESSNPFIDYLQKEDVILFYATQYYLTNPNKEIGDDFAFTDLKSFSEFVKGYHFEHEFEPFKLLESLETSVQDNYGDSSMKDQFKSLETKLAGMQEKMIMNNADLLNQQITDEIILRYKDRSGLIEASLDRDQTVLEAAKVLLEPEKYNKILGK